MHATEKHWCAHGTYIIIAKAMQCIGVRSTIAREVGGGCVYSTEYYLCTYNNKKYPWVLTMKPIETAETTIIITYSLHACDT